MAVAIVAFAVQAATVMGAAAISPAPEPSAPAGAAATPTPGLTPTPSPTTTPSPTPTPSPTERVELNPGFSFTVPAFSPANAVHLTGTKDVGGSVVVTPAGGGSTLCTIAASSATEFSCSVLLASGKAITLSAIETLDGVASASIYATIDVLGAPTIDGAPAFLTTGLVSGYGLAGSTVSTVLADGTIGCTSITSEVGYWSCALSVPSGPYVVRAKQSRLDLGSGAFSSLSGPLALVVDRDAPGVATIISPAAESRVTSSEVTVTGTGELAAPGRGGVVDLYVDNRPACQATIVGDSWTCAVSGISPGAHSLRVIQRDAAGNFSVPSTPITVYFGAKPASITPIPSIPPKAQAPPLTPAAPDNPDPDSGTPDSTTPDSAAPAVPGGSAPNGSTPGGSDDTWGSPTAFGRLIPALSSSVTPGNLLTAPLLALAFIMLVALPLRLLTGALRGRVALPSLQFTGRNRSRTWQRASLGEAAAQLPRNPSRLNPWLAGAVPLAAAASLIVIAGGVDDQVRYLRLTAAVVLGLAVLNVVGVAVATRAGSRWHGVSRGLRFVPLLLLAALLAALLSRATGLNPPVLAGVVIGVGFTTTVGVRARAIVSLVEIGTVTMLAALAWLVHGFSAGASGVWASGFWGLFVGEVLATIALAGLGSVVVLVLPIATLPGRSIFEWSRPAWLAIVTVVSLFASVVVLAGVGGGASFPIVGAVLLAGAFAALSVAVWGWLRFVDPA